jgi:gluconate 5-dehydrogenase
LDIASTLLRVPILTEAIPAYHLLREEFLELRHVVQAVPRILGVVMRVIRGPDRDVLEHVPQAVDQRLVRFEIDEAVLVEHLDGIDQPIVPLEGEQVREARAPRQDQGKPRGVPFGITDLMAVAAGIDGIVARYGRLDCLVNNAAVRDRRPFPDITADNFRRLIETNLVAQYEVSRVRPGTWRRAGRGRFVFISSMVGPSRSRAIPPTWRRRAGLEALMRALAVELGAKGISANAIARGFFLTEVNAALFAQPRVVELARRIPLQRLGRPDELMGVAIFLASDAASYITGQVLTVDAGLSVAL